MGFWKRLRWLIFGWDGGYCNTCGNPKTVDAFMGAWCDTCDHKAGEIAKGEVR